MERFARGRHAFERARDIFKFTLLAALASTTISATVGVTSLVLGGLRRGGGFQPRLDDLVAGRRGRRARSRPPALLLWSSWSPKAWKKRQIAEGIVLVLALVLVAGFVFGGLSPSATK